MNILFVGGAFNDDGGRPSSVVSKFNDALKSYGLNTSCYNGGYYSELEDILAKSKDADAVLWWANVPNDKPKIRDVKSINPKTILITSKRNDNGKYNFAELIDRALSIKTNLFLEFSKSEDTGTFMFRLFDPLGNEWYEGIDIVDCSNVLVKRIKYLASITRQGTVKCDGPEKPETPDELEFFGLIKNYAEVFHVLVNPAKDVKRFLGNSSFRCQRGFPSFKKDGIVYVSRRNVDKRYIDKDAFVPSELRDGKVFYWGDNKPSVDTPIQLRLYDALPQINYMIHAHVYIKDAPFTDTMVPCGGLEEVDEIIKTILKNFKSTELGYYAVNLIGHGCIVMADSVEKLRNINYVGRDMPEKMA